MKKMKVVSDQCGERALVSLHERWISEEDFREFGKTNRFPTQEINLAHKSSGTFNKCTLGRELSKRTTKKNKNKK